MGNISHASLLTLLFIVTISTSFTTNNAQAGYISISRSRPYTPASHAPAPSPSHHHHNHHPGGGHHRHAHSPAPSPSYSAAPPQPSKPVTPSLPKPPTTTYPTTPSVPPTQPPVKPPTVKPPTTKPPTSKPGYPPVKAPSAAPTPASQRKFVAVEGMVYCKQNCTYAGINTLLGASPLPGAKVVIRCRNTKFLLRKTATTDKNGYYFLQAPPLITTYGAHKCKVYLARKPRTTGPCTHPTDLNSGSMGAYLFSNNTGPPKALPTFSLFTVGPFAYESTKCYKH